MIPLYIASASLGLLVLFVGLFAVEAKKNKRLVLKRLRDRLDVYVLKLESALERFAEIFGSGGLRVLVHYIIHLILHLVHVVNRRFSKILEFLMHRNRKVVQSARKHNPSSRLHQALKHRDENPLDDDTKEDIKKKSIEG